MDAMSEILNQLNKISCRPLEEPTAESVMAEAKLMAARGFNFDEPTLKLLKTYLATEAGLLLLGNVGVGKTFFFKARKIPILSMQRVCEHSLSDVRAALDSRRDDEILIDDIGAEGEFNDYGVKMAILPVIIEERLQTAARTHFTTNLSLEKICDRYGARTFDRIKELAKLVICDGESKRRAGGARIEPEDFFIPRLWESCAARCRFYDEASRNCIKRVKREPTDLERCPYF